MSLTIPPAEIVESSSSPLVQIHPSWERVLLQDVVENYKRTEASRVARILLGQRYYEEGDYDAAIDTYETFLRKANRKPELKAMAREGLAYAHEAKEDFAQAAIRYEELSKSSLTNVQGWAYLGMARCYERLGEEQKATDAYRALLADHPQHPKAEEARANIARLKQSLEEEAPGEGLGEGMPEGGAPGMD